MDIIPIMCSLMKSLCIYNRKQLEDLWKHCCKYSTMQKCVDEALGFEQGALHWLQETMCPYDMLLDSHKKLYNAFGLGRSLFAVWNIHSMFCYAERILAGGQTLPKSYSLVKEDLHQELWRDRGGKKGKPANVHLRKDQSTPAMFAVDAVDPALYLYGHRTTRCSLGGDFALDQTGKVIMRHSLRRSWDRPTANEIVKALK
uniref:uncharacterized protein isoform X2 n=1 Tax=Myxine glutinosa TaxID=7769 RepID=UPI00358FC42E